MPLSALSIRIMNTKNDRADATQMRRFGRYGFPIFAALGIAGHVALAHKEAVIAQRQVMLVQPPVTLGKISQPLPPGAACAFADNFYTTSFSGRPVVLPRGAALATCDPTPASGR